MGFLVPLIASAAGAAIASTAGRGGRRPKAVVEWTPEQWEVSRYLSKLLRGRLGKPLEQWPGPYTVPLQPQEYATLEALRELAASPPTPWRLAAEGYTPWLPSREAMERYWREALVEPVMREYRETLLPELRESFRHAFWGSERLAAERELAEDVAARLAAERARLAWQEEMARREALERAFERQLEASRWLAALPVAAAEEEARLGALERAIREADLERRMREWLRTRPEHSPYLQAALSYLRTMPVSYYFPPPSPWEALGYGLMGVGVRNLYEGLSGVDFARLLSSIFGGGEG